MQHNRLRGILIFLLIYPAPIFSAPVPKPDSSLAVILKNLGGTTIRLADAREYAVKNAAPLRQAEASYRAAEGSVRRESGYFDPQLFFDLQHLDEKQPVASFFAGAPILATRQTSSQSGLRMNLPIGTQVELSLNTQDLATNSSLAFLNPEYDAFGTLTVRQTLLRGFAASARKNLSQSETQFEAARARYEQEELTVRTNAEVMYWDLYAAVRDFAVQQLTRDRADEFLRQTELRARAGLVGPNQVANAQTFLAEQELLLIERREEFESQSDRFAAFIGIRPADGDHRYIPVDSPSEDFPAADPESLVSHALAHNLDIEAAQKDVESAQTVADAASWESLPDLTIVGSIGSSGLAGTGQQVLILNDTLPTPTTSRFSEALTQVGRRNYPNWTLGLQLSMPIGLRTGLGEKDRLEAVAMNARETGVALSRMLEEEVRSTYRELVDGKNRLRFARQGVDAAQEQVRIGLIEFSNGRSTAFELVRLGEDYAVAQQRYSAALVRTAKAAAVLQQLTSGWYPAHMEGGEGQ